MHNKKKCKSCVYHMKYTGGGIAGELSNEYGQHYMCGYGLMKRTTCLKNLPGDVIVDIRGEDPDNCQLYTKGHKRVNSFLY